MKRHLIIASLLILAAASASAQVRITAHRGFWSPSGAENSIASLSAAQKGHFWGTEFDVHLTSDNVTVINHDNEIGGVSIHDNPYEALREVTLHNGEPVPTLKSYLRQGARSRTMLVLELKNHGDSARCIELADSCIAALRREGLFNPKRVMFISFNYPACRYMASAAPGFQVQYLRGDKAPAELHADGITGLDYHYGVFREHPEWISQAHELGMDVNVWTVSNESLFKEMTDLGVDCITTNSPQLLRKFLRSAKKREIKAGKN